VPGVRAKLKAKGYNNMRFMMIVKADKDYEAGLPPAPN
jgi:hypothetical protein